MNTRPASARRGQPVLALCMILMIWTVTRAAMWQPVFAPGNAQTPVPTPSAKELPAIVRQRADPPLMAALQPLRERNVVADTSVANGPARNRDVSAAPVIEAPHDKVFPAQMAWSFTPAVQGPRHGPADSAQPAGKGEVPVLPKMPTRQRWAFDQWLLMRGGTGALATASGAASYGGSQAGAVARYRLAAGERHDAYGYARVSAAINAPGNDRELAIGIGVRPLAHVPLRVLGEARLYASSSGPARMRPVVTVITELPWQKLPGGVRAEVYGQAGFAGGSGSTAFFDMQAVVDHAIPEGTGLGRDLRIGAGVWAGGQKGAVRLDAGPRVSLPVDLADDATARIALDWRLRVAGNANPASGPALTIASSF